MSEIMKKVEGFFNDSDGNPSFGRLAAGYCVVCAMLIALAGLWLPALASYCAGLVGTFLLAAGGLYGTSKGQQVMSSWAANKYNTPTDQATEVEVEEQK